MQPVNTITPDLSAILAQIEALKAENAALRESRTKSAPRKELKASPGGLVTFTGYRRFPIALYRAEIEDILARAQEIKSWIAGNESKLAGGKNDPNAAMFEAAKTAAKAAWDARQVQA